MTHHCEEIYATHTEYDDFVDPTFLRIGVPKSLYVVLRARLLVALECDH